jgi:hypothetical protein
MDALRLSERRIVKKYGVLKEKESWRIKSNKKIAGCITRGRHCLIYKIVRIELVWTYRKDE